MSEESLPKEYKGFPTAELLEIWKSFPDRNLYDPPLHPGKNAAWRDLLREYAIMDFGGNDPEKIKRSKRLLAPYGIDPAPWADADGLAQAELRKSLAERMKQERKARRERNH